MRLFFKLVGIILVLGSCRPTPENKSVIPQKQASVTAITHTESAPIYTAPHLDSSIIENAIFGTRLSYADSITPHSTRIKFGGVWYEEPWIAIRTPQGKKGWIFGGLVDLEGENSEELEELLLEKRMKVFLGELAKELVAYRDDYARANTAKQMADVFHRGEELREKIVEDLKHKLPANEVEELPDIFWIEDVFPGYVLELVAEGTAYYLFKDFKQLYRKSRQTTGYEDDVFSDLSLLVYQRDSLEYFYPAWFLQTWDFGGHSLLGSGIHQKVLASAEEAASMSDYFKDDIATFKNALIEDIVSPNTTYWNHQDSIISELQNIINANYKVLNNNDLIAIKHRLQQFQNFEKNKIELNIRTGEKE